MKYFIFTITFLLSNTISAAPSYDKTVKWLIEKTPIAGTSKEHLHFRPYEQKLVVKGKEFALTRINPPYSSKNNSKYNNDKHVYTFNIKDVLSVEVTSNCKSKKILCGVVLHTKDRAVHRKSIEHVSRGRIRRSKDYDDKLDIRIVNADYAIRIGKAFQHLIDITDSSEPF